MARTPHKSRFKVPQKVQLGALAALAAVTIGVVGFAVMDEPDAPPSGPAEATKYLSEAQAKASAGQTKEPAVDTKAVQAGIQAAVKGNKPIIISVLGDSTGDKPGEWVDLWAKHLAQYGTVTLHMWEDTAGDWAPKVITYPGSERQITIWNGSKPGANNVYAMERLSKIQPEKPTFQILNYGHNYQATRADGGAYELLAALRAQWDAAVPTVITLQNPATGVRSERSQSSQYDLREWAKGRYPVIDVFTPFTAAAGKNLPNFLVNDGVGVHPNPAGQKIWVDTVIKTLG